MDQADGARSLRHERGWGVRCGSKGLRGTSPRSPTFEMVRLPGGKNSIQPLKGPTRNPHFYISEAIGLRRRRCLFQVVGPRLVSGSRGRVP